MFNDGLNLGQCIKELTSWHKSLKCDDDEPRVFFEFCHLCPGSVHSYRGYYEDLALGYDGTYESAKISNVLSVMQSAVGQWFSGYKGGQYLMTEQSTIWVANDSDCGDTSISGFYARGSTLYIVTKHEE